MSRTKKEASFEKDLEQLEGIVAALEEGGLSLDDSLKRFEEGIRLARTCEKALGEAEKKIEILTKNAQGELEAQPFGEDEEEEEATPEAEKPVPSKRLKHAASEDDIPPEPIEETPETEEDLLF